jgi:hypothetical protein
MTARLTPEQVAEIRARAAAATKGPWGFYDGDNYADVAADLKLTSPASYSYRQQIAKLEDDNYWDDAAHEDHDDERAPEQMRANAAFIAHARQDVPALVAEIDALRGELAEAHEAISHKDAGLPGDDLWIAEQIHEGAQEAIKKHLSGAALDRCQCGHVRSVHQGAAGLGGAQCLMCPGDSERSWRHLFTAEPPAERVAQLSGTARCGHTDYHDAHDWDDRPGMWCPGIRLADDEGGAS